MVHQVTEKHYAMRLGELLSPWAQIEPEYDREVTGLCLDSRKLNVGDIFFACAKDLGANSRHIHMAIEKGAAAVVYESQEGVDRFYQESVEHGPVLVLSMDGLRTKVGEVAARFYGYPSKEMTVIGVTGTNGKTSCTQFLAAALELAGKTCGVIGTLGNGLYGNLAKGSHTTPDPVTVQTLLANMRDQGATHIAMEVSSHGLEQHRVAGVDFTLAVFTNLTRDHLDYHGDMESYGSVKAKLFQWPSLDAVIINADDVFGQSLLKSLDGSKVKRYGYQQKKNPTIRNVAYIKTRDARLSNFGIQAPIQTPWGAGLVASNMIGRFSLSNVLAVISALGFLGIPIEKIMHYVQDLPQVPGRMEVFGGRKQAMVVVDYAHTPDAMEKVLAALKEHCHGKLWCIFGCGGNRDRGKRALMARVAESYAHHLILTDDNPRHEDPDKIISEILAGFTRKVTVMVEHDRARAIKRALSEAKPEDVVLIAGKGHEDYQLVGDKCLPFSDRNLVKLLTHDCA